MKKFTKLLQLMMLMLLMSTVAFGQTVISADAETKSSITTQEQEFDLLKQQYLQSQTEQAGVEEAENQEGEAVTQVTEEEVLTETLATGETIVLTSEQKEALESAGYMSEGKNALESAAQVFEILGAEMPELEEGTEPMDKEQFAAEQPAVIIDNKVFPTQTLLNPDGSGTVTLGSDATSNGTTTHPTPYGTYYLNHRVQYLMLASELISIGLAPGDITAIAFNVAAVNNCSSMLNYTMKIKGTTATELTTIFDNGTYQTVWTDLNFLPVAGWNTHTFTSPFNWDGIENVLIDICFDIIPGPYTQNASVYYSATTGNMANSYRADAIVACGTSNAATTSPNRANMQITGEIADCLPPTGLTATNLTTTSADLGWTSGQGETIWNVEVGLPGFTPGTGTSVVSVTGTLSNPWTAAGLNPVTNYEFYVQADCGTKAISLWGGPLAFQTTSNPLSGTYTINSANPTGGTNFQSFTDFADAINLGGFAGPVVVNVVSGSGPYNEQVMFGELPNSSAVNTLTINGNGETLEYLSTVSTERATLKFNGTDYVTVNDLVVKALGELTSPAEYGWAVWLTNNADYNTFIGCEFIANKTTTSLNFSAFVTSTSATSANTAGLAASNLKVLDCTVVGGYYGLVVNGPTSAPYAENAVITGNTILDFHLYGLYVRGQNNGIISGNNISRPTRTTTGTLYGIYLTQDLTGTEITKNRMFGYSSVASTSTAYGIYGTGINATTGDEVLIANNAIYGFENMNGTQYGMYLLTTNNARVYHNTISLDNVTHTGSSLIRGIHHSGTSAVIELLNNVISVTTNSTGAKYCLYFATNTAVVTTNYNVLHMGATSGTNHTGYWSATSYTTLADWQAVPAQTFDANSSDADPLFTSPGAGNLKPGNAAIDNMGTNLLSVVPDDILGVARTSTPDPGAWEFDPPLCVQPTALTATNITANSADLGWTENNTPAATQWDIEFGPAGFTPTGVPTYSGVSTNPFNVSGLTGQTSYDWYIRAKCSPFTSSVWTGPGTFTTECDAFIAPFYEPFQNTVMPDCWSMSGPQPWLFTTTWPGFGAAGLTDHTGTGGSFAGVDGSGTSSLTDIALYTPFIDVSALTNPQLRFYLFNNNVDNANWQALAVDFWDGAAWNNSIFYWGPTDNDPNWVEVKVVLSLFTITGDVQFRFVVEKGPTSPFYDDIIIDDVYVEEGPTCPDPVALNVTNIGPTSADLEWTSYSGLSDIEFGLAGFTPTGTPTDPGVTSPYAVTGLTVITNYEFYVRDDCGGEQSNWVGPYAFSTTANPLSGNYTINSTVPTGGTNFISFTDFATAMNLGGFAGPVVVDVVTGTGPYNEQVMLGELPNSSAVNTLTINGNGEKLEFLSTNTNERATLKFDGTDYVTVNDLVVEALGSVSGEFGWAVWLTNSADFNTFAGCEFIATQAATLTNFAGFVTSSSATGATTAGLAASNLTVQNCIATGGYYGMVINGPTSAPYAENNVITDNQVKEFYLYGLYLRGLNNSLIEGNEISRPDRTTVSTFYGIYMTQDMSGTEISKNRIFNPAGSATSTSTFYGFYGTGVEAIAGSELLIANNAIYNTNMNGTQYGMYLLTTNNVKLYHNTISLDNVAHPGTSLIRGIHHSGTSAVIELLNNIISVTSNSTGIKYCLYFATSTAVVTSNYNVLHMGATAGTNHTGYWNSISYTTLGDWQAVPAQTFDANSSDADPIFANPANGDLKPTNAAIDDMGTNLLAIVPDDILGVARTTTPDPGAWEFVPPACPQPSALSAINVTSGSADLDWTENGTATSWDIELGIMGFTPTGTPTFAGITVKPHTVSGLIAQTSYDWYVRADCGVEQSGWSGPHTFTTLCEAFVAPFFEPFQNTVIPDCWNMYGPQNWLFTTTWPDYGASGLTDHTGTGGSFAGVDGSGTAGITGITLETPMIDVSALTNPTLRFYLFNNNTQADPALHWQSLRVDLWDGAAWNNSIFYWGPTDNNPNWVEVSVLLTTYTITGDIQIRFVVDKSTGSPFYDDLIIDDVEVFDQFDNDARTESIDVAGFINGTGTFSPMATVKNNGLNPATFDVNMTITDGYASTVSVTSLAAGASVQVTFDPWTPVVGDWTMDVCTDLTGDEDPTNDCLNQKAFVRVLDKEVYAYRSYITPQGPVKFNLNNPSGIQLIENTAALSTPYAGAWVKGFWYASESDSPYNLVVFNPIDGSRVTIGPSGLAGAINGMAYDGTTATMYAITSTDLYTMDLTTGAVTLVAPMTLTGTTPVNLACSPAGMLYTVTLSDDILHSLDKLTGVGTAIGHIGTDINFAQDMEFDPETGDLFMAAYSGGGTGNLRFVDVTTGMSYFMGWFGAGPGSSAELTAFAIPYGHELTGQMLYNNNAAKPMNNSEVILSLGALQRTAITDCSGNFSFSGLDGTYGLTGFSDKERGGTNLADINLIVAHLLGNSLTGLPFLAADVNIDGLVTLADYNFLVSELLGLNPVWNAPDYVFELQNVLVSGTPVVQNVPTLSSGDPDGSFTPPVSCPDPIGLGVASVGLTSVDLIWTSYSGSSNIQWGVAGFTFGTGTTINGVTSPYTLGGLTQSTSYDFYVQDVCCGTGASAWVGPFNFSTADPLPLGTDCANAVVLTTAMFPYVQTGLTTCGFVDVYDHPTHPGSCYYYINGEDFVYEYTPVANITLDIVLTNTLTWTGITVSQGCPDVGTCVGYSGSSTGNPSYLGLSLTGGVTYYIIVSTWPTPNCTPFDISITVAP
jgi:hypothetical protein